MPSSVATSTAMASGASTCAPVCAICCRATALGNRAGGTISAIQACRAGAMNAKPRPMISVPSVSSTMVIASVTTSTPMARMTRLGMICPTSTRGFLRRRSAMTPPMGERKNMPTPEPMIAMPAEVLLPVMS